MLKIVLIRHFPTDGNMHKRYIGITDEPLCEEGKKMVDTIPYPSVEEVFTSPLIRCRETARLIYQDLTATVIEDLKECDFGEFENKNYLELSQNEKYQAWVDSNGILPFPGGEEPEHFKARTINAFQNVLEASIKKGYHSIALVVHGGTIMSILESCADPKKDYYHWQVDNGKGYIAYLEEKEGRLLNICSIH